MLSLCLPAGLLLRDTSQISYISHLLSYRRLWQTIPIFKSRNDGPGMRFKNIWAARYPSQDLCNFFLMHCQISYIEVLDKKTSFPAIVWFTQMYSCWLINGGGAIEFVILPAVVLLNMLNGKILTDVFGARCFCFTTWVQLL